MTADDRFEHALVAWLEAEAGPHMPPYADRLLARTARTAQRPRWSIPERWLPMTSLTLTPAARFPRATAFLLVLAVLVALVLATFFIAGSQRHVPPRFGPAANGMLAYDVDGQIRLASPDGSSMRTLETPAVRATHPVFSADGTRIAYYVRSGSSGTYQVAVMNSDGTAAHRLGAPDFVVTFAAGWSPDGTSLLVPVDDQGMPRVAVVRTDGSGWSWLGGSKQLATGAWWSSDGAWIAFRAPDVRGSSGSSGSELGLYVIRPDGSDLRRLATSPGSGYAFSTSAWAPDGSHRIAYYVGDDGRHQVAVMDIDTGRETIVSPSGREQFAPSWSPDGRRIAMIVDAGHVVVANADGSGATIELAFGPNGIAEWTVPAWSPDGTKIYAVATDEQRMLIADAEGTSDLISIPVTGLEGWYSWQRVAP